MQDDFDREAFRGAYSRFLSVPGRVLLTGHSHQAWPDVARDALVRSFDDAAELVDDKWPRAVFPKMEAVGRAVLERMGFPAGDAIAFGKSTHELVSRFLSSFRIADKPRIVTTTGEFHSLHRQLARFAEEGAEVEWVPAEPRAELATRLLEAITPGTQLVAFSAVLFEDAYVLPALEEIVERAVRVGAIPLVDAYHAFNVVPLSLGKASASAFVTAGGYKYAEFGEGISWLRIPEDCELRPLDTGWFADFGALSRARVTRVEYGAGGARFSGATFDPTALYRAEAVLAHWERFGLTVEKLRKISLRQTNRILARLDERQLAHLVVSARDDDRRGGFVSIRLSAAERAADKLRTHGVFVDARHDLLRFGPAPYLTDEEIDRGLHLACDVLSA